MPRAFTDAESDRIRARLKQAAAAAFARRGVRGTTVADLARAAGISKGAFYGFYDSKESLLLEIVGELELAMHAEIEAAVRADPAHGLDVLVDSALHALERMPVLAVVMSEEGLRLIASRPPEDQQEWLERDVRLVRRVVAVLEEAGGAPGVREPVLLGLLRSLVFVGLHREEIGAHLVDEVGDWLKRSLRAALVG